MNPPLSSALRANRKLRRQQREEARAANELRHRSNNHAMSRGMEIPYPAIESDGWLQRAAILKTAMEKAQAADNAARQADAEHGRTKRAMRFWGRPWP